MTINTVQFQDKNPIPNNSEITVLFSKGVKVFSTALAFYCAMQLIDSSILTMKEMFFPDLLSVEEKLDIDQAALEAEILDLRADCINPVEIAKLSFFLMHYLSKIIKVNRLTNAIGVNKSIKEKICSTITSVKNKLLNPFSQSLIANRPSSMNNLSILDQVDNFDELVRNELANRIERNDPIIIATAALDVVDLVIPHSTITAIVETGKILSELKKTSEEGSQLHDYKKSFNITGHASKAIAEFTSFPMLGKVFGHIALTTGFVLKIVDKENAA